jgi:hypothetical protein
MVRYDEHAASLRRAPTLPHAPPSRAGFAGASLAAALTTALAQPRIAYGSGPTPSASAALPSATPSVPPSSVAPAEESIIAPSPDELARLDARCAELAKTQHAAIDKLAAKSAKGFPAKLVKAAKQQLGRCTRTGPFAVALTIEGLEAAAPPARDSACKRPMAASEAAQFGCFDPPCPDCVRGKLRLHVLDAKGGASATTIGSLAREGARMRSNGDAIALGKALGSLEARVGGWATLAPGRNLLVHCGTVHHLDGPDDPFQPGSERCEAFELAKSALSRSSAANGLGTLTGEIRFTPEGPKIGIIPDDRSSACGSPEETAIASMCVGPRLWAPVAQGQLGSPYRDPGLRAWMLSMCRAAAGAGLDVGAGIAANVIADAVCADLTAGKPLRASLTDEDLAVVCGAAKPPVCPIGDTFQTMYGTLRDALR